MRRIVYHGLVSRHLGGVPECAYPPLHRKLVALPECETHNVQTDCSDEDEDEYCRSKKHLRHPVVNSSRRTCGEQKG